MSRRRRRSATQRRTGDRPATDRHREQVQAAPPRPAAPTRARRSTATDRTRDGNRRRQRPRVATPERRARVRSPDARPDARDSRRELTARAIAASSGASPATTIDAVAERHLGADVTPGSAATACSTVFAHAPQSMPSTRKRRTCPAVWAGGATGGPRRHRQLDRVHAAHPPQLVGRPPRARAPSSVSSYITIRPSRRERADAQALEQPHVVRDQLLVTTDDPRQVADAAAATVREREQHRDARRIGQRLERRRPTSSDSRRGKRRAQRLRLREVQAQQVAGLAFGHSVSVALHSYGHANGVHPNQLRAS